MSHSSTGVLVLLFDVVVVRGDHFLVRDPDYWFGDIHSRAASTLCWLLFLQVGGRGSGPMAHSQIVDTVKECPTFDPRL